MLHWRVTDRALHLEEWNFILLDSYHIKFVYVILLNEMIFRDVYLSPFIPSEIHFDGTLGPALYLQHSFQTHFIQLCCHHQHSLFYLNSLKRVLSINLLPTLKWPILGVFIYLW